MFITDEKTKEHTVNNRGEIDNIGKLGRFNTAQKELLITIIIKRLGYKAKILFKSISYYSNPCVLLQYRSNTLCARDFHMHFVWGFVTCRGRTQEDY